MVSTGKSTKTTPTNPTHVVVIIRDGTYRQQIETIRGKYRAGDKAGASALKLALPAVLWSGTFTRRAADALRAHSGLLCADLDHVGPRLPEVKARLVADPCVYVCFISPGGDGIKTVYSVPPDPSRHKESFHTVATRIKKLTALDIDPSGKDVCRQCFLSWDPEVYFNPDATEITLECTRDGRSDLCPSLPSPVSLVHPPDVSLVHADVEAIAQSCVPSSPNHNHPALFRLARGVLALERKSGGPLSKAPKLQVFNAWHSKAKLAGVLDPAQNYNDYLTEFMNATMKAKIPLGEHPILSEAWDLSQTEPPPPEASDFEDGDIKQFVSLLWQLDRLSKPKDWFVSTHVAAELFHRDWRTISKWFRALVAMEIIVQTKPHDAHHATRYRFVSATN